MFILLQERLIELNDAVIETTPHVVAAEAIGNSEKLGAITSSDELGEGFTQAVGPLEAQFAFAILAVECDQEVTGRLMRTAALLDG